MILAVLLLISVLPITVHAAAKLSLEEYLIKELKQFPTTIDITDYVTATWSNDLEFSEVFYDSLGEIRSVVEDSPELYFIGVIDGLIYTYTTDRRWRIETICYLIEKDDYKTITHRYENAMADAMSHVKPGMTDWERL